MANINVGLRDADKKLVGFVDLTPTWGEILPILISFIEHGNAMQQEVARTELTKMATLADTYNVMAKEAARVNANTSSLMDTTDRKS